MNTSFSQSPRQTGFTLIELLTVIAIIAVLMGLLFPAITGVKEAAKKVQAKNDAVGLVNAVKAYYTEYGKYPLDGTETFPKDVDGSLTKVLTATETNTPVLNPRKIAFMEIPAAKGTGSQPKKEGLSGGNFYDPWGNIYQISIDTDYDNSLSDPTGGTVDTGILVWSVGKDKVLTTGTSKSDDVYSWK